MRTAAVIGAALMACWSVSTAMADETTTTTTTRTTTPDVVIETPPPNVVVTDQADCTKTKVTKTDEATGDTMSKTKTRCD